MARTSPKKEKIQTITPNDLPSMSDALNVDVSGTTLEQPPINPSSRYFKNLAVNLTAEESKKLANICVQAYNDDEASRSTWKARYENWLRLLACRPLSEKKTDPFEGAANVLMPVLTIACTQFWARAIDAIYPASNIVKGVPVDDEQENVEKALRVGKHMSYQILYQMPNFYEGMASSMMQLPMSGTVIRKTYYDTINKTNVSEFINPNDFVVNYYTRYLNKAKCMTHIIYESYNEMVIKQNASIYSGVTSVLNSSTQSGDLSPSGSSEIEQRQDNNAGVEKPREDIYKMRKVLEQHIILPIFDDEGKCILDKEDGIAKKFIVTIDLVSQQVLRIVDPTYVDEETEKKITCDYFTKYSFIPSADGSFYSMGFGLLLEATNETINTIINQLIDAGTLANTQNGLVNKRTGLKRGQLKLRRGEYIEVDLNTDDIRKAIMPLSFKEPSQVLFMLLDLLQKYSDRVTTVSDVFTGEMPRSDTSATAITTTVEQGLKVFSAIYRSIHVSFGEELRKLFHLNSIYLDDAEYLDVVATTQEEQMLDQLPKWKKHAIAIEDYKSLRDVVPASDPNAVSKTERIQKARLIYETSLANPLIQQNPVALLKVTTKFYLAILENTSEVNEIIEPLRAQVQQFQQQQQQQAAMMQQNEMEMQMKAKALGMHAREMQEGIAPQELVQGAMQDQAMQAMNGGGNNGGGQQPTQG